MSEQFDREQLLDILHDDFIERDYPMDGRQASCQTLSTVREYGFIARRFKGDVDFGPFSIGQHHWVEVYEHEYDQDGLVVDMVLPAKDPKGVELIRQIAIAAATQYPAYYREIPEILREIKKIRSFGSLILAEQLEEPKYIGCEISRKQLLAPTLD